MCKTEASINSQFISLGLCKVDVNTETNSFRN